MRRNIVRTTLLALLLIGAIASFAGQSVAQDNGAATPASGTTVGSVTVLPPDAVVAGATTAEWGARQWQWAVSFPEASSPSFDPNGERCGYGQHGPVFFIPGAFAPPASEPLTCVIPTGVNVLLTVGATECSTVEPPPFFGRDEAELAACAAVGSDVIFGNVAIDGQDLGDLSAYRAVSPIFTMNFPEDNFFAVPAGPASAVSDGYFLMLAPLSPGEYALTITADLGDGMMPPLNLNLVVQAPVVIEPAVVPDAGASPEADGTPAS